MLILLIDVKKTDFKKIFSSQILVHFMKHTLVMLESVFCDVASISSLQSAVRACKSSFYILL